MHGRPTGMKASVSNLSGVAWSGALRPMCRFSREIKSGIWKGFTNKVKKEHITNTETSKTGSNIAAHA